MVVYISIKILGKKQPRPLYLTSDNNRWPSKITGPKWKMFDDNKRGGMCVKGYWVKTEKDIQGKETTTTHGIDIKEIGKIIINLI